MGKSDHARNRNRLLLVGVVLFGLMLVLAIIFTPSQQVLQKIGDRAPQVVEKFVREVKFYILPAASVASAGSGTGIPLQQKQVYQSSGPLRVSPTNPRYFTDDSGRAIYLTGSHTWSNFQDNGGSNPPPVFNYPAYLDFLKQNNHNFFRLWVWEQSRWTVETPDDNYWFSPMPYQRTGPGTALDGQAKFDLTKFNQAYFDRMRQRIILARDQGIYVSIMLFDGWSIEKEKGQYKENNPWRGHPFNKDNNNNGIDGDTNNNDSGEETATLSIAEITSLQEAYVRKVIDTVNDLDNVLYEISNESNNNSEAWQYHMIDYIHQYEAGKPNQHPVGMTAPWPGGYNPDLFASPAEWISPNNGNTEYLYDPPAADGSKVIIADTDHLCGVCGDKTWVWKSFTRGENVIFMDGYDGAGYGVGGEGFNPNDPQWVLARKNMGYTLTYANRMNLAAMQPFPNRASSGYCLANPTGDKAEFLVYLPSGGEVTVDLSGGSGTLKVEWLNPSNGNISDGGSTTRGGNRKFTPPFSGDAVLYLYPATTPAASSNSYLPRISRNSIPTPTPVPGASFLETFEGMPASPQSWSPPDWDVQVHSRDIDTWLMLETMQADHGTGCEPPPTSHFHNGVYPNAVFQCRDHIMTSLNAGGYGEIYVTPNRLVDFSSGEAIIRFDMSTKRTSDRDWVDLWVTPYSENLALPIDTDVDLQGAPKNSIHIRMAFGDFGVFTGEIYRNFQSTPLPTITNEGYEQVLTPSAKDRSTFELRISRTHIRFGMPKYNLWWIDTNITDLGWSQGVLQLGHHSYNPEKNCVSSSLVCLPNTWHWDNVSINPATPFNIIKADQRYVMKGDASQTITFSSPAPANAFLRFSGIGKIEVSFNDGPFKLATKAQSSELPGIGNYHPEHLSSYWVSVPQGTKTVKLRFSSDDWYTTSFEMIAKDFAIWSLGGN